MNALISTYIGTMPVSEDPDPAEQSMSIAAPAEDGGQQGHCCEGRRGRET